MAFETEFRCIYSKCSIFDQKAGNQAEGRHTLEHSQFSITHSITLLEITYTICRTCGEWSKIDLPNRAHLLAIVD